MFYFSLLIDSWERSYIEMKMTIAISRALVEVMELLSKDADSYGVGRQITEEVYILYIRPALLL